MPEIKVEYYLSEHRPSFNTQGAKVDHVPRDRWTTQLGGYTGAAPGALGIEAAKLTHRVQEGLSHEGRMLGSQLGEERQQERFLRTNLGEHTTSPPDQVSAQHPSQLRGLPRGSKLDQGWGCTTLGERHTNSSHPLIIIVFAEPPSHKARVQR